MMRGFTLIEVMIATAIASVLSVALLVALRQTMNYQIRVDTQVDAHTRAAIFQNQFEQDFMGFFVPSQAYELVSTKTGVAPKEKAAQIDKIFYAVPSKEQFGVLSFITDHAMQVYWGETMGAPKPLVARIVYTLVPVKDQKDTFTLQRQESKDLDFAHFDVGKEKSKIRAYDIVDNVKSMKVTYLARVYKTEEKKGAFQPSREASADKQDRTAEKETSSTVRSEELRDKKIPSWTYKEFTEWDWSPKKTQAKDKNKTSDKNKDEKKTETKKDQTSRVPFYIKVDLVLWDAEHTREIPFSFVFARKPYEMAELEADESPFDKRQPQMPSLKPVLDMLNFPGLGGKPAIPAQPVTPIQPRAENVQKITVPNMGGVPKNNMLAGGKSMGGLHPSLAKLVPKA